MRDAIGTDWLVIGRWRISEIVIDVMMH